ncbi:hypothetical protein [Natrarchaeobaculum sulfurireducens]|uniref:Uncharacterized protein n=1 Tax=Natrarchaeobaculum sulfurireducens TaxID=2044521 RepID=A0A346PN84_9EURY|nr:hypothetical protein [Natrarchaeobaculum sulfurireducens]AXR80979.1 hypothetical protein AArcMg_0961 [Natrarchaeobaculum sulfurireducens]
MTECLEIIERLEHAFDRKVVYEPRSDGRWNKIDYEWCPERRWRFVGERVLEEIDVDMPDGLEATGGPETTTGP